jgi:hypothetical protein
MPVRFVSAVNRLRDDNFNDGFPIDPTVSHFLEDSS